MTRLLEADNELVNDSMHVENWTIRADKGIRGKTRQLVLISEKTKAAY